MLAPPMQLCSSCQKAPATIVLMDLDGGNVSSQQHLCSPCAEKLGVVQPKAPMKMSAELLEDLLGSVQGKAARQRRESGCAGCGLTVQQFKNTGRLGCPRCYETFRNDLVPLLQRVHESSQHKGRLPGVLQPTAQTQSPAPTPTPAKPAPESAAMPAPAAKTKSKTDELIALRKRLEDAVRGERYEEAASLRDALRKAEEGESGSSKRSKS
jgi:protein arginine kinase activator